MSGHREEPRPLCARFFLGAAAVAALLFGGVGCVGPGLEPPGDSSRSTGVVAMPGGGFNTSADAGVPAVNPGTNSAGMTPTMMGTGQAGVGGAFGNPVVGTAGAGVGTAGNGVETGRGGSPALDAGVADSGFEEDSGSLGR